MPPGPRPEVVQDARPPLQAELRLPVAVDIEITALRNLDDPERTGRVLLVPLSSNASG